MITFLLYFTLFYKNRLNVLIFSAILTVYCSYFVLKRFFTGFCYARKHSSSTSLLEEMFGIFSNILCRLHYNLCTLKEEIVAGRKSRGKKMSREIFRYFRDIFCTRQFVFSALATFNVRNF